jgi:UDP-N-acetylglucosamine--N-acetylmuramyl-(pentapeptide) pyrophosphoryl-undecaprenol N-acetylglucosamine transferase
VIGYYIHHHGHGHLARAGNVAAAAHEPVVALSSLAEPAAGHPFARWITLTPDAAIDQPADSQAGGALHWAPLNSDGYRLRMRQLSDWVTAARPRLVVVDASVEVTALLRLLAVPVVVVAGAGHRDDDAHRLAYRMAARIIVPWPRAILQPGYLAPFGDVVTYVGAFSRYDHRPVSPPPGRRRALLLLGSGGTQLGRPIMEALRAAVPDWTWRGLGGADLPWSSDVWGELQAADVVVTPAGMNALAEVAASRRPAVVIPQPRPFGEQHATAQALGDAGLAITLEAWPPAGEWGAVLTDAQDRGGASWERWNDGHGARRFAECLARTQVGASRDS